MHHQSLRKPANREYSATSIPAYDRVGVENSGSTHSLLSQVGSNQRTSDESPPLRASESLPSRATNDHRRIRTYARKQSTYMLLNAHSRMEHSCVLTLKGGLNSSKTHNGINAKVDDANGYDFFCVASHRRTPVREVPSASARQAKSCKPCTETLLPRVP